MKKRFSKLSKAEQEKVELAYHQMKPEDFDEVMTQAEHHSPNAIRLSPQVVETLKTLAEIEGEPRYQELARRWIEERLQQEARLALRLAKLPLEKVVSALNRQVAKKPAARA